MLPREYFNPPILNANVLNSKQPNKQKTTSFVQLHPNSLKYKKYIQIHISYDISSLMLIVNLAICDYSRELASNTLPFDTSQVGNKS